MHPLDSDQSKKMQSAARYPVSQRVWHYMRRFRVRYFRRSKFSRLQAQRSSQSEDEYSFRSFDEHRCIFVHIPKCAGISVCQSLFGNLAGAHQSLRQYQIIFSPSEFAEYFKFTFVRNPWDRLVSAFFFLKNGGLTANDKSWSARNLSPYPDFETFVRKGIRKKNILSFPHFRPQWSFICLQKERPAMDFIGYFENLEADFAFVRDKLKINSTLQERNRNSDRLREFGDYYTAETRQVVAEVYAADVRVLGYTFDNSNLPATLAQRDSDGVKWHDTF